MKLAKIVTVVVLSAAVMGCTKPSQYSEIGVQKFDDDTTYRITDTESGFRVLVNYGEYQFIPARGRAHQVCRDRLREIAVNYARDKNRKIAEIDEAGIRVDSGRNGLSGVTTCTATYQAKWVG